jgi:fructoselysine-6-P-deglycase FrlB-like protein
MEYRHGPISVTAPGRVAWMLGSLPAGLSEQIAATGGLAVDDALDPMADLVRVQRLAVAVAARRGLDPDHPRALTRSVILP